jgi:cation diffusion facilitator family transporter
MNSDTVSTSEPTDSSSQEPHPYLMQKEHIIHNATKAVYVALAANLLITSVKLVIGIFTRSSAMLSEAVHSFADAFNSMCLIVGLKRGCKPPDSHHPFGYGLEANAWTLVACILMFMGALVSFYWGLDKIVHQHDVTELINHFHWILVALVVSLLLEIWAVNNATRAVLVEVNIIEKNPVKAFFLSIQQLPRIKSPTTKFVWFEETAALTGVIVALIAVSISRYVMPLEFAYIPDGIASLIIGMILLGLAVYLFNNYLSTLGAAAKPQIERVIKETTLSINGISQIYDLKTMDMGASGLIVNLEVEVDPETQVKEVDDITEKIEEKLKEKVPAISHVNIEVQAYEEEENWSERFEDLIKEGVRKGVINYREGKTLLNLYEFTDKTVYEVMVPRTDIDCLEVEDSIEDLIDLVITTGHTRIPIYRETIDNVIGVVHSKDIFRILQDGNTRKNVRLEDLSRELSLIPENKSVSKMLNEFIMSKHHIGLVADEHGGIAGLVTIEDLIEEVFGEIWDEYDVEIIERKRIDDNSIQLSSKISIEEINERYGLDISTEEFQTIGGFIFGHLGRVPIVGDQIPVEDVIFTVEKMDGHKIEIITIYRKTGIIDRIEEEEFKQKEEEALNHNGFSSSTQ